MHVLSHGKASLACDLFLNQKLYKIPQAAQVELGVAFPNVKLSEVNVPNRKLFDPEAEIYWGNRITEEIITNMPKLRWIHFGSVGVNRARFSEVIDRDILVTNSKGLVVAPMVVSVVAFLTSLARGVHHSENLRKRGLMNRDQFDAYFDQIHDLEDQKCLIVGYGDVGKSLAPVLKAFGMNVTAIKKNLNIPKVSNLQFTSLDDLLNITPDFDYVVNLLPLTKDTENIFSHDFFAAMKRSAFFINIGRGETVDESALIAALKSNSISGAGLDVFAVEPLSSKSELWSMDNVILTPHVAGLTSAYWPRQIDLFFGNLKSWLEGDLLAMKNIVDLHKAY